MQSMSALRRIRSQEKAGGKRFVNTLLTDAEIQSPFLSNYSPQNLVKRGGGDLFICTKAGISHNIVMKISNYFHIKTELRDNLHKNITQM